jgi:4-diphosphocytidyl-2-C-methyl-D-erythritol kinase
MQTEAAPAKINLYLHVVGRRDDGYHLLDSLVAFAEIGDVLRAEAAGTLSLAITGPFGAALRAEPDNLVLRAARALSAATGMPPRAHLTLEKHLPIASGIGGGSADAAAALRLLQRLWRCPLPAATLHTLALGLGADVPVCLAARPARMGGIGEHLAPAPALPDCGILLVNPGISLSTPEVFGARSGAFSAGVTLPQAWPDAAAMAATLRDAGNDLEPPARRLRPVIDQVLDVIAAQPACLLARMSGSGATCFGLFPDTDGAQRAATTIRALGWWCRGGVLRR